jgi:hypothetical protein
MSRAKLNSQTYGGGWNMRNTFPRPSTVHPQPRTFNNNGDTEEEKGARTVNETFSHTV